MTMKSKTILIAYQDDLGTRALSTFFHSQGYRVDTTRVMSEMIRRIRKGNFIFCRRRDWRGKSLWSLPC
jgi:hypothetical protein